MTQQQLTQTPPDDAGNAGGDCWLRVDHETAACIRFAAELHALSDAKVVAMVVRRLAAPRPAPNREDRWAPFPVTAHYKGQRVEGTFVLATQRLVVTSGPCRNESYSSPSTAARAVISAIEPTRPTAAGQNGWSFWRDAETGQRLSAYRHL